MNTRREFLGMAAGALATAGCATVRREPVASGARVRFGACLGFDQAERMKDIGFDFIERDVASALMPDKGEDDWKKQCAMIRALPLPLMSCNGFLPGRFRLTGKEADHETALKYAVTACRRADEAGVKTIVFGSGGARNVPAAFKPGGVRDWPWGFGPEEGRDQFAAFCRELAKRIAGLEVTVVIEPLSPNETNIVNYVWQGMQIVDEVASPRLEQLADIYHMLQGREPARSIVEAGRHLRHVHIAEPKTRQFPGHDPAAVPAFKPYFDALRAIGYTGGVSCECGWGDGRDFEKNLATALATLKAGFGV